MGEGVCPAHSQQQHSFDNSNNSRFIGNRMTKLVLMTMLGLVPLLQGAPQMFIWNCDGCPYQTKVTRAGILFDESSEARGELKVQQIEDKDGDSSLEIRGPMSGVSSAYTEFRIHADGSCSNLGEVMHVERCKNCQTYVSLKILSSKKLLTLGGDENDVLGKTVSVFDARKGSMLGCGTISPTSNP